MPVDQRRLVLLLNQWEAEIQGWAHAADQASLGEEYTVAMRNRVRADTIRECRKELLKICQQNARAMTPGATESPLK
jgi:hypothetical protein